MAKIVFKEDTFFNEQGQMIANLADGGDLAHDDMPALRALLGVMAMRYNAMPRVLELLASLREYALKPALNEQAEADAKALADEAKDLISQLGA